MIDARRFFDEYICAYSTLAELVLVLQHTYLFGSRCLGAVLRQSKRQGELVHEVPGDAGEGKHGE